MENLIYHYTDFNALINIIGQESLTFWGSRYDCMNDPLDYQYARNKLLPTMMMVAKEVFKERPTSIVDELQTQPYVVSFSKKKDDFLMWRMYNAKVALILDMRYFSKPTPNSALIECEYVSDDYQELRDSFLKIDELINWCSNISAHTARVSTFIKNEAFKPEGEIRLATWDYYDKNDNKVIPTDCIDKNSNIDDSIESRINKDGKIILYKKFNIDKDALVGIIVHTYSELEFNSIKELLRTILINKKFSREVFDNIMYTSAYPFFK